MAICADVFMIFRSSIDGCAIRCSVRNAAARLPLCEDVAAANMQARARTRGFDCLLLLVRLGWCPETIMRPRHPPYASARRRELGGGSAFRTGILFFESGSVSVEPLAVPSHEVPRRHVEAAGGVTGGRGWRRSTGPLSLPFGFAVVRVS